MRTPLALAALFALAAAGPLAGCAGAPHDAPAAPAPSTAGLSPDEAAAATVRIYDVADLVTPRGDAGAVSDLATELHAALSYEVGDADPSASVASQGTSLVVRARPATHAWTIARLTALRGR